MLVEAKTFLDALGEPAFIADGDGVIRACNREARRVFGQVICEHLENFCDEPELDSKLQRIMGKSSRSILQLSFKDKGLFEVTATRLVDLGDGGQPLILMRIDKSRRIAAKFVNLSARADQMRRRLTRTEMTAEKLRGRTEQLAYLASTDSLTGLRNLAGFHEQSNKALAQALNEFGGAAVVVADLNQFKAINDRLGHFAGDAVIRHFADILAANLGKTDIAARTGGDEFSVLLFERDEDATRHFLERISSALTEPFEWTDPRTSECHEIEVQASFGVALAPLHGTRLAELRHRADLAMYVAKRSVDTTFSFVA